MIKRVCFLFLYIFIFIQVITEAASYFQKDRLDFDSGKTGFEPSTANLTHSATKIIGGLALENGTIVSGQFRTLLDYVTPFVGAIMPMAVTNNTNIPAGWLPCDGRELSISTFPTLYKAIGIAWGNPSTSTVFKIPNLTNYFLRSRDASGTLDSIRNVGTSQTSAISPHQHTFSVLTTTSSLVAHTHGIPSSLLPTYQPSESVDDGSDQYMAEASEPIGTTGSSSDSHTHTIPSYSAATAGSTEMLPKRMYLIYCIKVSPF